MVDSGSWYTTGFRWPHDGNPYETDHFIVYSDAASEEARRTLAEIGEELMAVLSEEFGIAHDSLFLFPSGQAKIHIYTYKDRFPQEWGGRAYFGGLMMWSLDHPDRNTEIDNYRSVVKHELMHVVQFLLLGSDDHRLVDIWLTEGIAEYVAGGTAGGSVRGLTKLEELIGTYGELNPIAIHRYGYPDIEMVEFYYYYPMFELAVGYLLDPAGAGREKPNIRDLFLDVREGVVFATALENRLGISLTEYEAQFFDLMRDFLH